MDNRSFDGNRAASGGKARAAGVICRFGRILSAPAILILTASAIPASPMHQAQPASLAGIGAGGVTVPAMPQPAAGLSAAGEIGRADAFATFAAQPFHATAGDSVSFARALACMTEAIYYEAATEPLEGQRAVAQVVLNRVRHPAFPKSICGVVYQGWHLETGCQFTFTCDGSLARKPSTGGWARARQIAKEALAGRVVPEVGLATHYHAAYVAPYWSSSLSRIGAIGAHIFYRWRGAAGSPQAFMSRYSGIEKIPERPSPILPELTPHIELALGPAGASGAGFAPRALGVIKDDFGRSRSEAAANGTTARTVPLNAARFAPRPLSIAAAPAADLPPPSLCASAPGQNSCLPSALPGTASD